LRQFFRDNKKLNDPGTFLGRIKSLQGDKASAQKFLGKSSFEKQFVPVIEQFLLGGELQDILTKAEKGIAATPGEQIFESIATNIGGDSTQKAAQKFRAEETKSAKAFLDREDLQREALVREKIKRFEEAEGRGITSTITGGRNLGFETRVFFGQDPVEAALGELPSFGLSKEGRAIHNELKAMRGNQEGAVPSVQADPESGR
jgi:hypothetical protein